MDPQRATTSRSRGATSAAFDGVRRLYVRLSDRVYRDFAWAFEPITTILTLGWMPRWRSAAVRRLPPDDILDLGCGTGALLHEIGRSHRGHRLVGIDLSRTMATIARRRNPGGAFMIVCADVTRLPFRDGSFGGAVTTFPTRAVLDHEVLIEAGRVLRQAGGSATPGRLVVVGMYLRSTRPFMQRLIDRLYGASAVALHRAFIHGLVGVGFVSAEHRPPADLIEPTLDVLDRQTQHLGTQPPKAGPQ